MTRSLASNQKLLLMLCASPYLVLVLVDWWIHDKRRRVSAPEGVIHLGIAFSVGAFLSFVVLDRPTFGVVAFLAAITFLAVDELKFHRDVSVFERRIHYAADLSLLGFMLLWATTVYIR